MIKTFSCNDLEFNTKELVQAFEDTGFIILTDHGIMPEAFKVFYKEWEDFFNSPLKENHLFDPKTHGGFFPMRSEKAKDAKVADLKEFFHFYKHSMQDPTDGITVYIQSQLHRIAHFTLNQISKGLPEKIRQGLSEPLSGMATNSSRNMFRILHYPAIPNEAPTDAVRAAAHEDINLITLLPAATTTGLEVLMKDGTWYPVECDPNSIIVNVGDMLQEATGGFLKSTTHRVVNGNLRQARYSAPYFLHARPEVVLSDKYTAETYLDERLRQLGLK